MELAAPRARVHGAPPPSEALHKPLLDVARKRPILTNVYHHIAGRHFPTSTYKSILGGENGQAGRKKNSGNRGRAFHLPERHWAGCAQATGRVATARRYCSTWGAVPGCPMK